jgi:hypothetical protein
MLAEAKYQHTNAHCLLKVLEKVLMNIDEGSTQEVEIWVAKL